MATTIVLVVLAIVSFTIGLEEISWGQRILDIESNRFFIENNMQQETNFHNLNTHLFEKLYYVGAFVAFIVIPFFSNRISQLFRKNKYLNKLDVFLSNKWFFAVFASTMGLIRPSAWTSPFIIIPFYMTLILLIDKSAQVTSEEKQHSALGIYYVLSALALVLSSAVFPFIDYEGTGARTWFYTKYKEMYIAMMILLYSCSIAYRHYISLIQTNPAS